MGIVRRMKMNTTKKLVATFVVAVLAVSLSGCADINGLFPLTPQQIAQKEKEKRLQKEQKLRQACNNADVLLSELNKPVRHPIYSLSPGVVCNG